MSESSVVPLLRLLFLGAAAGGMLLPAMLLLKLHDLCAAEGCSWGFPLAWVLIAALLMSAGLAQRCPPRGRSLRLGVRLLIVVVVGLGEIVVMVVTPVTTSTGHFLVTELLGNAISLLTLTVGAWLLSLPGLVGGVALVVVGHFVSGGLSASSRRGRPGPVPPALFCYAGVLLAVGVFWLLGALWTEVAPRYQGCIDVTWGALPAILVSVPALLLASLTEPNADVRDEREP